MHMDGAKLLLDVMKHGVIGNFRASGRNSSLYAVYEVIDMANVRL